MNNAALSNFSVEDSLGNEKINPLQFPTSTMFVDFALGQSLVGLDDQKIRSSLKNRLGAGARFEASLSEYFHAGVTVSMNLPIHYKYKEPISAGLTIYAKPQLPFKERLSLFTRLSGGISSIITGDFISYANRDFKNIYGNQTYQPTAFGAELSASIGIEYFLALWFGIALEAGIKDQFFFHRREDPIAADAPQLRKYMIYSFPLTLNLLVIF